MAVGFMRCQIVLCNTISLLKMQYSCDGKAMHTCKHQPARKSIYNELYQWILTA